MERAVERARIDVNDGARSFLAEPGRPLLFALMSQSILVPSACGGRASCGQCRVRILSGADDHIAEERAILPEAERAAGIHLACQVRIKGEMRVSIPEAHLQARRYLARVAGIRDLAPDMREIDVDLLSPETMAFKAGQYVQFLLPGTENEATPIYRAYSVASPPSSLRTLTLLFGRVSGGICSSYVFDRIRVGEQVRINGPFGQFHVREGARELLFIAGGSGMAPIRSILLDLLEQGDPRPATLFCAGRAARDLIYAQQMRELAVRVNGFRYVPTLSQPLPEDRWEGHKGGVAALLGRLLPSLEEHEAYLCGSPGMIDASINVLKSKGLGDDLIHFDKFS